MTYMLRPGLGYYMTGLICCKAIEKDPPFGIPKRRLKAAMWRATI